MGMTHLFSKIWGRAMAGVGLGLMALSASLPAAAQAYPNKPIRFVVPFPAGSATDSVGRILAQAMGDA